MFENAFNNIDRALRNDEGLASELDYAEQTSWLLFLKYLETERRDEAELEGKDYSPIVAPAYSWKTWAAPKTTDGKLDHNAALTGADLIDFVNGKLFPYLKKFRESTDNPDSLGYKIGEIFSEIGNKFRSGYSLRDALEIVDQLDFGSQKAKHELSDLYETRIKRMGNAGRNGGEYYTPRPLIRAMIKVTDPQIGEIFSEIGNKFRSGYSLRDALEIVDQLDFGSQKAKHELSDLYETRIKRMGNAGRNGGEYYTPRPLIRAMIKVTDPQIGETIYDGACGSAGFLCEAWEYLRRDNLSASDWATLQRRTFYGQEKKSLAYVLGVMNMILHGIEAPSIRHTNTLTENVMDIQERDRHDIVLANPPFGGGERKEVQQNFAIKSGETAYLFLQHFMRKLRAGGRGAVVIKNTFLSNTDGASVALRKELLESCNLHTVLDCPGGTFQGAGVKTVVLFFEKGSKTRSVWYYQLDSGRSMGKTNPLNDDDLAEFVALQPGREDSAQSWSMDVADLDAETRDLSVKNPNAPEEAPMREPAEIIDAMLARDAETAQILEDIRGML